jgi:tetratricopeptide (TPR) repeat protein
MMTRSENGSSPDDPDIAGLDALDGEWGPSRPLSAPEAARITERLMRQLESTSRPHHTRGERALLASGRRAQARWPRWLLGAAGVTLAAAAAALYGAGGWSPKQEAASGDRRVLPAQHPTAPTDPSGRPTEAPNGPLDGDGGREPRTMAHESKRAADHLARANALRGKRQYREALDLYLYVVSEYPDSMQSRSAQLAAAAIRLEQLRDIDGAEELYQAVLDNSHGELAAQAAFGIAEVARARADRSAEARALREFLARHASHPLAAAARRRLGALESP